MLNFNPNNNWFHYCTESYTKQIPVRISWNYSLISGRDLLSLLENLSLEILEVFDIKLVTKESFSQVEVFYLFFTPACSFVVTFKFELTYQTKC